MFWARCGWWRCTRPLCPSSRVSHGCACSVCAPFISHLSPGDMFQQVHRIVKQALQRYSEDRIGMVDYALESGGVCCLHHFALSWFLQWLGLKSARQHSAKQTARGQYRTPSRDSHPRPVMAEGSHESLSSIPGWERLCEFRLELTAGFKVLIPMFCEETGNSSSTLEPRSLLGLPIESLKKLSLPGQEPVLSVPGVPRLTRQRRPSSASSASPCGTTHSHPESFSRWALSEGPVNTVGDAPQSARPGLKPLI